MTHQDQHDLAQHDLAQHDQAIEEVLHALRNPEPPQGYETRIHNALLQAQQHNFAHSNVHNIAPLMSRHPERSAAKSKDLLASLLPKMSWAAACAVLVILGIVVRNYTHHETPHNTPALAHITPTPKPIIVASVLPASTIKPLTKLVVAKQRNEEPARPQRIEVALETHENIPEPPLPLTDQERLVLRMARRNDAQQLAEYTPDALARHLHEDAQAYNSYFAEKPLDGQPIYHQQISGGNQ